MNAELKAVLERFVTNIILGRSFEQVAARTARRCRDLGGVQAAAIAVELSAGGLHVVISGEGSGRWNDLVASWSTAADYSTLDLVAPANDDHLVIREVRQENADRRTAVALFGDPSTVRSALDDATMLVEMMAACGLAEGGARLNRAAGRSLHLATAYLSLEQLVESLYHSMNGSLAVIGMSSASMMQEGRPPDVGIDKAAAIKAAADDLSRSLGALDEMLTVWTTGDPWCDPSVNVVLAIESLRRHAASVGHGLGFDFNPEGPYTRVGLGGATVAWMTRELLSIVLTRIHVDTSMNQSAARIFVTLDQSAPDGSTRLEVITPAAVGGGGCSAEGRQRIRHLDYLCRQFGCLLDTGVTPGSGIVSLVLPPAVR